MHLKNLLLIPLALLIYISCNGKEKTTICDTTTFTRDFFKNNQKFRLRIIQDASSESEYNSYVCFYKKMHGSWINIYSDSIWSLKISGWIKFKDYNNDKINDLTIFSTTGARGCNSFYYLYLFDAKTMNLKKIKNYNDYPTIELDTINNIFISKGCYGNNVHFEFLRLNKSETRLIELGFGYEDEMFDSNVKLYNQTIKKIITKYGKSIHL